MPHSKTVLLFCIAIVLTAGFAHAQLGWKTHSTDSNGDLVAIYFTSATKGFIAGDKGYLASTADGGRSWRKYTLNTTENINEIYFRNEKNGYLVAGKKLFITSDGGESWRETVIFKLLTNFQK